MKNLTAFTEATNYLEKTGVREAAFGIDLGTTNSAIAVVRAGTTPEIIKLSDGRSTMPSCIMWKGGDRFVVGREAYKMDLTEVG